LHWDKGCPSLVKDDKKFIEKDISKILLVRARRNNLFDFGSAKIKMLKNKNCEMKMDFFILSFFVCFCFCKLVFPLTTKETCTGVIS